MGAAGDDIEDLALGPPGSGDDGGRPDDDRGGEDAAVLALAPTRRVRRPVVVLAEDADADANDRDAEDDPDAAADEAVGTVPGTARVWIKTMGCAHNVADSEQMAGVLMEQGYRVVMEGSATATTTTTGRDAADVWLLNSCTVKDPSEQAVATFLKEAHARGKAAVIAGCVPQGQRSSKVLLPPPPTAAARRPLAVGLIGVAQLGRVAEVVESAIRGESIALLGRGRAERALPDAELPQARRNPHVAIVPLSQGCAAAALIIEARVLAAARDPLVREIHLSSEDVGAYGRDRGTTLAALLERLTRALDAAADEHGQVEEAQEEEEVQEVQEEEGGDKSPRRRLHRCFLRVGMSNPPFLLRDGALDAVSRSMCHRAVFRWLHLPVQSGDDGVLKKMNREYTRQDFEDVVAGLTSRVPGLVVCTDVIVGFPSEDEQAFERTLDMLRQHRFKSAHITRFYPRPGTPAARYRPRIPTQVQKARSSAAARVLEGRDLEDEQAAASGSPSSSPFIYSPYCAMVGTTQRVVVVDVAADGVSLVAHARDYAQVLLVPAPGLMGAVADVRILSASRWSVRGEVVRVLFSPPVVGARADEGAQAGEEALATAAAARARVRAAKEKRAKAAAAAAASGKKEGEGDSAAPCDQQQLQQQQRAEAAAAEAEAAAEAAAAAAAESSARELPPTPPKWQQSTTPGEGQVQEQEQQESQQQQRLRQRRALSPPRSSSSTSLAAEPSTVAAASASTPAAAASSPIAALSTFFLSAGLLLLAAALLALGTTTLRDLGRLA